MSFEEKLKSTKLPEMAIVLLPSILSERIKGRLSQCDEMEAIIQSAIKAIENGSVETVEKLIEQELNHRGGNKVYQNGGGYI